VALAAGREFVGGSRGDDSGERGEGGEAMRSKRKPAERPLVEAAIEAEKSRRRRISCACLVLRAGLRVEQLLQWLCSAERRDSEPVARSWAEWGDTLKCHPATAKRQAMRAAELGLLHIAETLTRWGGDAKNRFAIDWEGVDEALGVSHTPTTDRGAKCTGEGCKMHGGGVQNAHAYKEHALRDSLEISLSAAPPTQGGGGGGGLAVVEPSTAESIELEALVARAGVARARDFTRAAIARGDDVRAVVEAWRARARAWRPEFAAAKLAARLRDGLPGCGPDEGWPAADFPHLLPKRPEAPKTAADEPARPTARESTAALAVRLGPKLEAMSIEERLELLGRDPSKAFLSETVRRGGGRGFLLEMLGGA
jgi:hypothetical protein